MPIIVKEKGVKRIPIFPYYITVTLIQTNERGTGQSGLAPNILGRELTMTKSTKKDGSTKQKSKGAKGNKTSGSANGSNSYH